MKKVGWILVLVFLFAGWTTAQGLKMLELQGGYLNPKDTPAGLILGGNYGIAIDERVDLSIGFSYFHKSFTVTSKAGETYIDDKTHETKIIKEKENSTTLLPLMANLTVHIPFQPSLNWYIGGSFGYEWLFNTITIPGQTQKRSYGGFGWIGRGGLEFKIGERSSLMVEAFYNSAKPKHDEKNNGEGIQTWTEVNVSGLGFRAGVRVELY